MNNALLETFLDVLETRNFNRTADRLGITQSSVSGRIKSLEKALGVLLFDRGRSGAKLTPMGLRFEVHARVLKASWDQARRDVGFTPNHEQIIYLAGQFSLSSPILVDWLLALRNRNPSLAVDLQANYSDQIVRDLALGLVDIAVLYSPQYLPDLHIRQEGVEVFVMVSTLGSKLGDVVTESYIKASFTSYFNEQHHTLLPQLSSSGISVGNEELALELLRRCGGSAYLPKRLVSELRYIQHRVFLVRDAPEIMQPVFSAVHARQSHNRNVVLALETLRSSIANL